MSFAKIFIFVFVHQKNYLLHSAIILSGSIPMQPFSAPHGKRKNVAAPQDLDIKSVFSLLCTVQQVLHYYHDVFHPIGKQWMWALITTIYFYCLWKAPGLIKNVQCAVYRGNVRTRSGFVWSYFAQ